MKMFAAALALVAGLGLAGGALAQSSSTTGTDTSSGSSSQPSQPGPSTPSSQTSQPASQPGQSGVLVDASSIIGATVRSQGKDIGKVDRLMVDPKDGRVKTVVIQMGGTLGVGGKSVSMPWDSVKVGQDGGKIVVSAEQQMLDQAPAASPRTDSKSENKSDKK